MEDRQNTSAAVILRNWRSSRRRPWHSFQLRPDRRCIRLAPLLKQLWGSFPGGVSEVFSYLDGECSSVGRALDCGSSGRGFDPHHSPQSSERSDPSCLLNGSDSQSTGKVPPIGLAVEGVSRPRQHPASDSLPFEFLDRSVDFPQVHFGLELDWYLSLIIGEPDQKGPASFEQGSTDGDRFQP